MKEHKGKIQNRTYEMSQKAGKEGEFSTLDYNVIASRHIIAEMHKAIENVFNKYPKAWEDK